MLKIFKYIKRKKLTLIELIIIIIIIGLLSAFTVPKFIGLQRSAKVSTMLKDIDTIETIIPVYFSTKDKYPIKNEIYTLQENLKLI